jgi:hypothetical protein
MIKDYSISVRSSWVPFKAPTVTSQYLSRDSASHAMDHRPVYSRSGSDSSGARRTDGPSGNAAARQGKQDFKVPLSRRESIQVPLPQVYHDDGTKVWLCEGARQMQAEEARSLGKAHLASLMTQVLDREGTHPSRTGPVSVERRIAVMERLFAKDQAARPRDARIELLPSQFQAFCKGPGRDMLSGSQLECRGKIDRMLQQDVFVQVVALKRDVQREMDEKTVSGLVSSRQPDIRNVVRGSGRSRTHEVDVKQLNLLQQSNEKASVVGHSTRAHVLTKRIMDEARLRLDHFDREFEKYDKAAHSYVKKSFA